MTSAHCLLLRSDALITWRSNHACGHNPAVTVNGLLCAAMAKPHKTTTCCLLRTDNNVFANRRHGNGKHGSPGLASVSISCHNSSSKLRIRRVLKCLQQRICATNTDSSSNTTGRSLDLISTSKSTICHPLGAVPCRAVTHCLPLRAGGQLASQRHTWHQRLLSRAARRRCSNACMPAAWG